MSETLYERKPVHFTCKEAIEYIKGLKAEDKDQPKEIEGSQIGYHTNITQWENYAIYLADDDEN